MEKKHIPQWILISALTLTFCFIVIYVIIRGVSKMESQESLLVGSISGYLATFFGTIVSYYFGSSKSSSEKDNTIKELSSTNNTPA